MSLVTLSGTISEADLQNNFEDKLDELLAVEQLAKDDWQVDIRALDLTTVLAVGLRTIDFTAPDDCQLVTLGLSIFNPDATSRTAQLTLTAIDSAETEVSKYLLDQSISVSVTGDTAAEHNATRTDLTLTSGELINLVKGITYRLQLTRTDANGGVIDSAYGFVLLRSSRRYR
jgi:hypothetical protein